jgi:CDP-diacylglycerol--serine O-phosphatidyltransferase
MVSRLPVLSGKKMGTRVRPDLVAPVILLVVLFIALLVSYPWHVLSVGTIAYLALLPLGWVSYRRHLRADAAAGVAGPAAEGEPAIPAPPAAPAGDDRPVRLN